MVKADIVLRCVSKDVASSSEEVMTLGITSFPLLPDRHHHQSRSTVKLEQV